MSETENEDELPYKIGDVVCRGNSFKSPAKIVGIQLDPANKHWVKLFVVTSKKRFCEWSGSRWYFTKPEVQAKHFRSLADYYTNRAEEIELKAAAAMAVTP